jgi:hypothetical protein
MVSKQQQMKLVVYVPKTHLETTLDALRKLGIGANGHYECVAFLTFGHGTWIANKGAKPFKGRLNKREMAQEVKLETTCEKAKVKEAIKVIRSIHPYELPSIEAYELHDGD